MMVMVAVVVSGVMGYAQEDEAAVAKKNRWQFGVTLRGGYANQISMEHAVVAAAGYRLGNNYFGINAGYGTGSTFYQNDCSGMTYGFDGIPITVEYSYYFPLGKEKKHSLYLGGEYGCFHSWDEVEAHCSYTVYDMGASILMLKAGFDFQVYKRLHLNVGGRLGMKCYGVSCGISF